MPPSESTPRPSLRIAVISRHFTRYLGGAENYAVSLVEQLAPQHDITVFCQTFGSEIPGVRYVALGWQLNRLRWLNLWLFSLWTWWHTRGRFDVVHSHENVFHGNVHTVHVKPMRLNFFIGIQGVRLWMRRLAWWISPRLLAYRWMEHLRLETDAQRVIVATSQLLLQELQDHFEVSPSQLHYLPPGVVIPDSEADDVHSLKKIKARQSLGLEANLSFMLMVGHDFRKKGLAVCLRALKQLPLHWHLIVVGNPDQIPQWTKEIEQQGISSRVHFLGILKSTDLAYQACDVMVHATQEDVFGMVALEAMAFKVPLIVSPAPYCQGAKLLAHQEQAMILPSPVDENALSAYVLQIESDESLRQRLAFEGRKFCQAFCWGNLAKQQEALYKKAIANRRQSI